MTEYINFAFYCINKLAFFIESLSAGPGMTKSNFNGGGAEKLDICKGEDVEEMVILWSL